MSARDKKLHQKVINMEQRGFMSLTLPKHNPSSLLKAQ
jgi:hypothetical protein